MLFPSNTLIDESMGTPVLYRRASIASGPPLFVQSSPNTYKNGVYAQFGINNPLAGPQFEGAPTVAFSNSSLTA